MEKTKENEWLYEIIEYERDRMIIIDLGREIGIDDEDILDMAATDAILQNLNRRQSTYELGVLLAAEYYYEEHTRGFRDIWDLLGEGLCRRCGDYSGCQKGRICRLCFAERKKLSYYMNPNREANISRNSLIRRSREKGVEHDYSEEYWEDTLEVFDHKCCYCGTSSGNLHKDHFIPISKGGGTVRYNIVPSCQSCNSSKSDKDFFDWYPQHKSFKLYRMFNITDFIKRK